MEALRSYMVKQFEGLMVTHLNKYYPKECETLGETDLRKTIQYGIERARSYNIDNELDVSRYINLMFTFGRDFDKDMNLPWASNILMKDDLLSPHKMDLLYDEAEKHVPDSNNAL